MSVNIRTILARSSRVVVQKMRIVQTIRDIARCKLARHKCQKGVFTDPVMQGRGDSYTPQVR